MKALITYTFLSGKERLSKRKFAFETFAIDILFDENLKPYILEINQPYAVEGANLNG